MQCMRTPEKIGRGHPHNVNNKKYHLWCMATVHIVYGFEYLLIL